MPLKVFPTSFTCYDPQGHQEGAQSSSLPGQIIDSEKFTEVNVEVFQKWGFN